jgi:hypothetical protein
VRQSSPFSNPSTPATPGDFETMLSKKARAPTDFSVSAGTNTVNFRIGDRAAVQRRSPTTGYRIYFAPVVPARPLDSTLMQSLFAAANLVKQIPSQGKATTITAEDPQFYNEKGWFICVGVNMLNEETQPINFCPSPWN